MTDLNFEQPVKKYEIEFVWNDGTSTRFEHVAFKRTDNGVIVNQVNDVSVMQPGGFFVPYSSFRYLHLPTMDKDME